MAISITAQDRSAANKAQFEAILQSICKTHGLSRSDLLQAEEDRLNGYIKLAFKSPQYHPELRAAALKIHDIAHDTFRGEVVRAAVPEFSKHAIELANEILNPKVRVITFDPMAFNYKWMDP